MGIYILYIIKSKLHYFCALIKRGCRSLIPNTTLSTAQFIISPILIWGAGN